MSISKLPFRALVLGPTSTVQLCRVYTSLITITDWEEVTILTKNLQNPLYRLLQKERDILVVEDIKDVPLLDEFKEKHSLLIVDDFELHPVEQLMYYWMLGRKNGVSLVVGSQSYEAVPKHMHHWSDHSFINGLRKQG